MLDDAQVGGWVIIPPAILFSDALSPTQKLVWGRVFTGIRENGYSTFTNAQIGEPLGLGESSVSKYLSELEEEGFLVRDVRRNGDGTERRLYPSMGGTQIFLGGYQNLPTPLTKDSEGVTNGISVTNDTSVQGKQNNKVNKEVLKVYNIWLDLRKKKLPTQRGPKPKLTSKRKQRIQARLDEGFSIEDIKAAILGCFGNPFHVEKGFTDIELICRETKIRQYISWYEQSKHQSTKKSSNRDDRKESKPEQLKSVLREF